MAATKKTARKPSATPRRRKAKPVAARRLALITGASSGIGLELARVVAAAGHGVVLVARTESRLQEIAAKLTADYGVEAVVLAADVSGHDAAQAVHDDLQARGIEVDLLVNNAGFGLYGAFVDTEWEREHQMMELNMVALVAFCKVFGRGMARRGAGRILNIASTAAFQPGPFMAVYYATKAFVLSFSEGIGSELRDHGVTVTALCPGPTETGFQDAAGLAGNPLFGGLIMGKPMDSATVAQIGYDAMMRGEPLVIAGVKNQVLARAAGFLPRKVVTAVSRWVVEK